jgi:hypothetical protein
MVRDGAFNPANVTATKVGTMTWTSLTVNTGNVFYTVNGVPVSKNVVRQTLVFDDFSGHFAGGEHSEVTGCSNPILNGTTEAAGLLYITQNGQAIAMQSFGANGGSCSYSGTLSQAGQMGRVQGSFVCNDGSLGTFVFFEMQVTDTGLTARLQASYSNPPGCQSAGWAGGVRGTTF